MNNELRKKLLEIEEQLSELYERDADWETEIRPVEEYQRKLQEEAKSQVSKYKRKILKERAIAAGNVVHAIEEVWRKRNQNNMLSNQSNMEFNFYVQAAQEAESIYNAEWKEAEFGYPYRCLLEEEENAD